MPQKCSPTGGWGALVSLALVDDILSVFRCLQCWRTSWTVCWLVTHGSAPAPLTCWSTRSCCRPAHHAAWCRWWSSTANACRCAEHLRLTWDSPETHLRQIRDSPETHQRLIWDTRDSPETHWTTPRTARAQAMLSSAELWLVAEKSAANHVPASPLLPAPATNQVSKIRPGWSWGLLQPERREAGGQLQDSLTLLRQLMLPVTHLSPGRRKSSDNIHVHVGKGRIILPESYFNSFVHQTHQHVIRWCCFLVDLWPPVLQFLTVKWGVSIFLHFRVVMLLRRDKKNMKT